MSKPLKSIDPATLFQALNTPYLVLSTDDPLFTVLEENEAHARVGRVKRSDVVGKPVREALPDTSDELKEIGPNQIVESIRRVIRTKKPDSMPHFRYDLKNDNGIYSATYWSVTHYPIFGKEDEVNAVYQEARDITDQTLMGQRLDRAEHQLNQMLSSSLLGTWSWDIAVGRVYTDANLAKLFGMSINIANKGLPLEDFIDRIHPDDQRKVQVAIDRTLKTQAPYEAEYRAISFNGDIHWVIARGYVELSKEGKPNFFSGIMFDITDRKRAEQAVVESEKRLRFMADSIPQLSWIARPDGYREYFNKQWYKFTGTILDDVVGDGWQKLIYPKDKTHVIRT